MIETNDIAELKALNLSLQAEIQRLRAENEELKARLAQNSTNSHKPPAWDGLTKKAIKPAFTNDKAKKQGGQPNHPGKTLLMSPTPDTVIEHRPTHCQQCGQDLMGFTYTEFQRRQVFDLPQPRLYVEEHRQMALLCTCGCLNTGQFPISVTAPVEYGPRIHAQSILFNIDYKLPFAKVRQLWADLTVVRHSGYAYNPATLTTAQTTLYEQLGSIETRVKEELQKATVCHFDETGLPVGGKLQWLHVACTALFSYLFVHPSRGQKALNANQRVFEGCTTWLVHDCWSSYFAAVKGRQALCGAHLLRELQGQIDVGRVWAMDLHECLLTLYKATRQGPVAANEGRSWRETYQHLCQQGLEEEPSPMIFYNKVGKALNKRPKQSTGRNLLDRLIAHQEAVLAFAFEDGVPFTNNEAERALRPAKIKQKVSGGFRTQAGSDRYARIMGFIATLRKQEYNVVEQLANVMRGQFQWTT